MRKQETKCKKIDSADFPETGANMWLFMFYFFRLFNEEQVTALAEIGVGGCKFSGFHA